MTDDVTAGVLTLIPRLGAATDRCRSCSSAACSRRRRAADRRLVPGRAPLGGVGHRGRRRRRRRRGAGASARRRQRAIEAAMPDAVELLVLCIHAGCSPTQAVVAVAARAPPPLGPCSPTSSSACTAGARSPPPSGPRRPLPARRTGGRRSDRRRRSRRHRAGAGARPIGRRCPCGPASSRRGRRPAPAGPPDLPARGMHAACVRAPRHRAGRARRPLDAAGERPMSVLHPVDERNLPCTLLCSSLACASTRHPVLHVPRRRLARAVGLARGRGDDGQATTEYALVLLAAALVALLVVGWATAGGGRGEGRPAVRPGHRLGDRQGVTGGRGRRAAGDGRRSPDVRRRELPATTAARPRSSWHSRCRWWSCSCSGCSRWRSSAATSWPSSWRRGRPPGPPPSRPILWRPPGWLPSGSRRCGPCRSP